MPKKKSQKNVPAPKAPMTKREASRWQKQKRQERIALFAVIATVALVAGIILFGIWQEIISPPGSTVATVGSAKITLGTMADNAKYQAKTLDRQVLLTQSQLQQAQAQAASDPSSSFLVQYIQQQVQQLQQERFLLSDGTTLLDNLIEQEVIRQEAVKRGVTVTAADIDLEIQTEFQPQESAVDSDIVLTDTQALTGTVALTPTPSPTPIPADAWKAEYQNTLTTYNITEVEFRKYTMEPMMWRNRLNDMIGATVATTTEQVHIRQILLPTEAEARDALALLKDVPTTKFEELANQRSTDSATSGDGGNVGWVARGELAAELEAVAFNLAAGQISDVISTTQGAYIIKVEEKDANHPMNETQLSTARSAAFNTWLTTAKASDTIKRYFDSKKQAWLYKQIPETEW